MSPDDPSAEQPAPRLKRILRGIVEWRFFIVLALFIASMIWWFASGLIANWKATLVCFGLVMLMVIDEPATREQWKRLIRRSWGARMMLVGASLVLLSIVYLLVASIAALSDDSNYLTFFDKSGPLVGISIAVLVIGTIGMLILLVGMLVTLFEIT